MSEISGFDRTTYGEPSKYAVEPRSGSQWAQPAVDTGRGATPEDEEAATLEQLTKNGRANATLLVAFLHALETAGLPHTEALYLTAHVWRLT